MSNLKKQNMIAVIVNRTSNRYDRQNKVLKQIIILHMKSSSHNLVKSLLQEHLNMGLWPTMFCNSVSQLK